MANIREISGRIRSIRDTMKITNAMYMISSTKMRKARRDEESNSPYFSALKETAADIIASGAELETVYFDRRTWKKGKSRVRAMIVITGDKGLAGAYNHNVLKEAERLMQSDVVNKLYVVGEVGRQYFAGKKMEMAGQFQYTAQNPTLRRARVIAERLLEEFRQGEIDEAVLVYTQMLNSVSTEATHLQILPMAPERLVDAEEEALSDEGTSGEMLSFVPSPDAVMTNIVPDIVVGEIYSSLIEAYCCEQNDRMIAMDAANKNAGAMIHELSVEYNRERQAMITQEITEVIAGAKAQKKKKAQKESR